MLSTFLVNLAFNAVFGFGYVLTGIWIGRRQERRANERREVLLRLSRERMRWHADALRAAGVNVPIYRNTNHGKETPTNGN